MIVFAIIVLVFLWFDWKIFIIATLISSPLFFMGLFPLLRKFGLYIENDKLVFKRFLQKQLDLKDVAGLLILKSINSVFDRLNRNGEPLEPQELRNAKHFNSELVKLVERLTQTIDWSNLGKVKINRMQDAEFVSELLFYLLEQTPMDASKKDNLDDYYKKWAADLSEEQAYMLEERFKKTVQYLDMLSIDFEKYKINGVSHFYALFALSNHCLNRGVDSICVSSKLDEFYDCLRNTDDPNDNVIAYRESMQANTRSKGQRLKRINALIQYCNLEK